MRPRRPIGLFDSGIGGLSIWQAVTHLLPDEATRYFADSAYCPYGPRPLEEVRARSAIIGRFLLEQGCKLIVVACNTASAAALESLRAEFEIPIIGLEPAIKPAAQATRTGHIGVLATEGTFQGTLFQHTRQRYGNGVQLHVRIGAGLVEQVEAGQFDAPATEALLRHYLEPMLSAGVDQLALGCTHYLLLMPLIERIVAGQATLLDPAQAVAQQVQRILNQTVGLPDRDATAVPLESQHLFFTSGHPQLLQSLTAVLTGQTTQPVQVALDKMAPY
ncbi:MAG TPA: glutamate racemase [Anaerolineae bacterium]